MTTELRCSSVIAAVLLVASTAVWSLSFWAAIHISGQGTGLDYWLGFFSVATFCGGSILAILGTLATMDVIDRMCR